MYPISYEDSVRQLDQRSGDALNAFRHPYAYAA